MRWYLLRTWIGREEELVKEIRRTVPPHLYHEAFVIYNERIWRRQGKNVVHVEPLFKGCVFLTCKDAEPLFCRLERAPSMPRLMAAGGVDAFPLTDEDGEFLRRVSGEDHVVRLSRLLKEDGEENDNGAYRISGPLEDCAADIEHIEFRKRFVKLRRRLWGEDRTFALGMVLKEDLEQGVAYENLKLSVEPPGRYGVLAVESNGEGKKTYALKGEPAAEGNGMKKNYA